MHKFLLFVKEFYIPKKKELLNAYASFSKKEFLVFTTSLIVAFVSVVIILEKINNTFMVDIPTSGGTITEGIIGTPTLVNPVLALSDADKDLTSIVYSGLMRKNTDGTFIPDLAEKYTISSDGMTYTYNKKERKIPRWS
jgi:ABC-type transport system substrate-binding protein